jgi:hypothetical protein
MTDTKQLKKAESIWMIILTFVLGCMMGLLFSLFTPHWLPPPFYPGVIISIAAAMLCIHFKVAIYMAYGLITSAILFLLLFFQQSPFTGW